MNKNKIWMLAILTLCSVATAQAQTSYDYFYRSWDADKKEVKTEIRTCTSYTAINGSDTSDSGWLGLYSGWYVVTGNSNYKTLNVLGDDVHLIIPDMVTLTLTGGVKLETGKKLSIYSQGGDVGQLIVTNSYSSGAGIGGGGKGISCGTLIVHGGIINATGNKYGAGIGGGDNKGFDGGLTIYGGNVTAQGGDYAAGIGSGDENPSDIAGFITIYGGTVTATGGTDAAGIGGGNEGMGAVLTVYGGSITATGGQYGAGIGGGDERSSATTIFYGGRVNATGGSCAAGIGGGDRGDAKSIEIRGGDITAVGGSLGAGIGSGYLSSNCEITISGGTINATGGNEGAGIGTGQHSTFNGKIEISGGTVTAIGRQGGAGIGGGGSRSDNISELHGEIIISDGTVISQGNGGGAGIGSGIAGKIHEDALIQILGGNVTASAESGGAIGAGGAMRLGNGTYTYSKAYCPIDIKGDNITLTLTPGPVKNDANVDEPSAAIRYDSDGGGSLTISGHLAVTVGETIASADNRVSALASTTQVTVEPCQHTKNTYTIKNSSYHTARCTYCGYTEWQAHATNVSVCVCGYHTGVETYIVTLKTSDDGSSYNNTTTEEVVAGKSNVLPDCMEVPQAWEFVGWVETTNAETLEQQEGETLRQPGYEFSVTSDKTFLARYRKIELSLTDTGSGNMSVIFKYNGILTTSVTLTDRTLYKDGSWNTLCLPFGVNISGSVLDGATVKTLSSTDYDSEMGTLTMNFSDNQATILAGRPYIVKWESGTDLVNPKFNDVVIQRISTASISTTYADFKGSYTPIVIYDEDKIMLYLGADNKLYYPNGEMTIGSCRAYFILKDLTAGEPISTGAKSISNFVLNFGDDEATSVTTPLAFRRGAGGEAFYSLDGRRITGKPTAKGIYIYNGRKIVIK